MTEERDLDESPQETPSGEQTPVSPLTQESTPSVVVSTVPSTLSEPPQTLSKAISPEVRLGTWSSLTNYECIFCDFATLDSELEVLEHIDLQRSLGFAHHTAKV